MSCVLLKPHERLRQALTTTTLDAVYKEATQADSLKYPMPQR